MKSIDQLLQLQKNPYYHFLPEEQQALNDFLSKNSDGSKPQKKTTVDSETNIPATVINKNVVHKETGVIPTNEQASISKHLGEIPVSTYDQERAQ